MMRCLNCWVSMQMTPGGATELMEVLGKEESLARIQTAIDRLSQEA